MKVRLIDIAKLANVSVATVSIVLNHPETTRISEEKKQEINEIAKELNYIPNSTARSLVTKQSKTIGFIIPDLENPFFSALAKTIEIECRNKGYVVIMMNTHENPANDAEMINYLVSRDVDGLIISLSGNSYREKDEIVASLKKLTIPYVLVDRTIEDFEANQVIFNNKQGQYLATRFLLEQGHRRIGYISTKKSSMTGTYRHLGYEKALRDFGVDYDESLVRYGTFDYETGDRYAKEIIETGVTAIACANDLIGFGVIHQAKLLGLRVPEDLSIVGYDDLYFNEIMQIGLTSVHQDTRQLGENAVRILMEAITGQDSLQAVVLEPSLTIRQSVKRITQ